MAEQQNKPKPEEQKPKSKLPIKTILVILAVLLLEAATISVFMVLKGGPSPAGAAGDPIVQTEDAPDKEMGEVVLVDDLSVDNYVGGRSRIVVNLRVTAKVEAAKEADLTAKAEKHNTEIRDAVRTLISGTQPENIRDPKLQVIKREIKNRMGDIVGEGLIQSILLPDWQSFPQD